MTITRTSHTDVSITEDTPKIISVNSDSDALRITQTGEGKAFRVEDSTNPDSTPFFIGSYGLVWSGTTSNHTLAGTTHLSNWLGYGSYYPASFGYTGANALGANITFVKSRGSEWGTYGIVNNGDTISSLNFAIDDGTDYASIAARITASVDGTPGVNDAPGSLIFSTTADGASTPTQKFKINSAGQIIIGSASVTSTGAYGVYQYTGGSSTGSYYGYLLTNPTGINTTSCTGFASVIPISDNTTIDYVYNFRAIQGSIPDTYTIGEQVAFFVPSSYTEGTLTFGLKTLVPAGTGNWNVYAGGGGSNHFLGDVLIGTTTAGASKLVVADDSIQLNTAKTPASAAATGTTGEIAWDTNYIYVCVATNTWKRAALTTW